MQILPHPEELKLLNFDYRLSHFHSLRSEYQPVFRTIVALNLAEFELRIGTCEEPWTFQRTRDRSIAGLRQWSSQLDLGVD
jgi:hypothetical protein